jgi:hypothetical protein
MPSSSTLAGSPIHAATMDNQTLAARHRELQPATSSTQLYQVNLAFNRRLKIASSSAEKTR